MGQAAPQAPGDTVSGTERIGPDALSAKGGAGPRFRRPWRRNLGALVALLDDQAAAMLGDFQRRAAQHREVAFDTVEPL